MNTNIENGRFEKNFDYIKRNLDQDIDKILANQPLKMGNQTIPAFDEFGVYQRVMEDISLRGKSLRLNILKYACVIALVVFNVGYFGVYLNMEKSFVQQEIIAGKGEKIMVALSDGSRVWLNADSKLVYPERFSGEMRKVSLIGEAYFEIKKDADHPFVVRTDMMNVKVLGTSFNLSAYPDDQFITTTLDEGVIEIDNKKRKTSSLKMIPSQTAVYDRGSFQCDVKYNEFHREESDWRDNRLVFRNAPLSEVLKELSRQFDVQFNIQDSAINGFTYDFVCKATDLNRIIETMALITPITFKKNSEADYIVESKY